MKWTTKFFGEEFLVEADRPYSARKKTIELYKEKHPEFTLPTYTVINLCRVRRHEDRRIKYN